MTTAAQWIMNQYELQHSWSTHRLLGPSGDAWKPRLRQTHSFSRGRARLRCRLSSIGFKFHKSILELRISLLIDRGRLGSNLAQTCSAESCCWGDAGDKNILAFLWLPVAAVDLAWGYQFHNTTWLPCRRKYCIEKKQLHCRDFCYLKYFIIICGSE